MLLPVIIVLSVCRLCVSRSVYFTDFTQLKSDECPGKRFKDNLDLRATSAYWRGLSGAEDAFVSSCNLLLDSKKKSGLMKAIITDLSRGPSSPVHLSSTHFTKSSATPIQKSQVMLRNWEILGPLPVGKLEADGDPTFTHFRPNVRAEEEINADSPSDIASYVLSMDIDEKVYSEMVSGGQLSWLSVGVDRANGAVVVQFPHIPWSELAQGTSSFAAFEFQGWARSTTYVTEDGQYDLRCTGVHTVYVRNAGHTTVIAGDVYRGGLMRGTVALQPGPVGIALPLRGSGSAQFACVLSQVSTGTFSGVEVVQGVRFLSHTLKMPAGGMVTVGGKVNRADEGVLLSPYFSITLENPHVGAVNVSLRLLSTLKRPFGQDLQVRVATTAPLTSLSSADTISIETGQVMAIPLELYTLEQMQSGSAWPGLLAPCAPAAPLFQIVIGSTPGSEVAPVLTLPLHLTCRSVHQSFLLSFLDHDGSIAEAAVILPLEESNRLQHKSGSSGRDMEPFPVLLSLHGTGTPPLSQADAYKHMAKDASEYEFGVKGFWVVAPSRHGAHNWEAVGARSAWTALESVQKHVGRLPALPQLILRRGIIAGHSMGGHGAWVLATNFPDFSVCVSATSSWIRKEDYGDSNKFFELDASASLVNPSLKSMLEDSMAEFHVDRLVRNMRGKDVHIRVGGRDRTTHPWFSRRMLRVLSQHDVNITYEEVSGKDHWWWDTDVTNDGGVLNDAAMRKFYSQCRLKREQDRHACSLSEKNLSLVLDVINPSVHAGICGVRVIQQFQEMRMSSVEVQCFGGVNMSKECVMRTNGNVRRVSVSLSDLSFAYGAASFKVLSPWSPGAAHIKLIDQFSSRQEINICWTDGGPLEREAFDCTETPVDPLAEKTLSSAGSIRTVYTKPLVYVYGTYQLTTAEKVSLKQLAVYHANSHYAAHHTFVRVFSDEAYILWSASTDMSPHNAVFIGARENRVMRECCLPYRHENGLCPTLRCRSPVEYSNTTGDSNFNVGGFVFTGMHESVVFTLPYGGKRGGAHWDGAAVCIASNSVNGYQHMTRLSWPVVPPMVRSPFANYIPDFMVIDEGIWNRGLGAVRLTGYWNATWGVSTHRNEAIYL